jgi:putative ABC transport system permease protein
VRTLWQDIKFAFRTLGRNPGFTAVAILTLSLGLGANASVFTLANAVLYKNLPFANSERILYISSLNRANGESDDISYPDFLDYRSQSKSFDGIAAFTGLNADVSDKSGNPQRYRGNRISAQTFSVIGQKPFVGRDFLSDDERIGAAPVAIISFGLWENRYARNLAIIGESVRVNEIPTTIVGVMPRGFMFPAESDVWLPLIPKDDFQKREVRTVTLAGRLADSAKISSARAEMETIARRLATAYPASNKDFSVQIQSFNDFANGGPIKVVFLAMLGAVGFVLLIACANVANLLLARAVGRSREISIRSALGASRWRIVRQLLVESVILSVAAGVLGWLASIWGIRTFDAAVIPNGKPAFIAFSVDYRVILYIAAITLGTGILFGMAPALRLSKLDINATLKDGGHGASSGGRGKILSAILVVSEMALAVVLLVGAGLMIRSFLKMYNAPVGVQSDNVLSMRMLLRDTKYPAPSDQITFFQRLHERLAIVPGVETIAFTSNMPAGGSLRFPYELEGKPPVDERKRPQTDALVVSPGYFDVMRVRPLFGRTFTEADGVSGFPVIIVNKSFADTFWPNEDCLGKRLRLVTAPVAAKAGTPPSPQTWLTVVGEIPDIIQNDLGKGQRDPIVYLPYRQQPLRGMNVVARTGVPPAPLGDAFRREVKFLDQDLPVFNLRSLDDFLAQRNWPWRVFGTMFAIFAAIALLLASVGLYAVIAHSVSQRTQEIGIRMSLGASGAKVLSLIFMQGMRQLMAGLFLGLAAAFGVTRVLRTLLVGVSPTDPVTFVTVALVLSFAGVLGCMLPARRAIRVDPIVALRHN